MSTVHSASKLDDLAISCSLSACISPYVHGCCMLYLQVFCPCTGAFAEHQLTFCLHCCEEDPLADGFQAGSRTGNFALPPLLLPVHAPTHRLGALLTIAKATE